MSRIDYRQNEQTQMDAAAIARIPTSSRESFLLEGKNPTSWTTRLESWYEPLEQTGQPLKSWSSPHHYGYRRSG
jgi:hypothetical protein